MEKRGLSGNNLNKKGLSEVVTTLLFVLFALMAVLLVWFVVKNLISGTSKNVGLEEFSANLEIPGQNIYVDGVLKSVSFIVQRGAGEGIINAVQVVLESSDGQSSSVRYDFAGGLNALDSKAVSASYSSLTDLKKISIAPIISTSDGSERTGSVAASASVPAEAVHGSVLSFDGVDDYLTRADIPTTTTSYSYSVWFYRRLVSDYGTETLLGASNNVNALKGSLRIQSLSGTTYLNRIWFRYYDDGVVPTVARSAYGTTDEIVNNQWNHLVVTVAEEAGKSRVKFYLNNVLVKNVLTTGIDDWGKFSVYTGNFKGEVRDVRIYERALTPEEVLNLYAGDNLGTVSNGMVGWWKLNEGSGTTALDSSGRGNDATIYGNPQWITG